MADYTPFRHELQQNAVKSDCYIVNRTGKACGAEEVGTYVTTKEGIKSRIVLSSYDGRMRRRPTSDYYCYDGGKKDLAAP